MNKKLLVMLTKYPEQWKVKTRLAKDIWFEEAAMVQEMFIKNILKNNYFSLDRDYDFKICLKEKEKSIDFINMFWVKKEDIFFPKWDDLWQVMTSIFNQTLWIYESVLLIWSDIPLLEKSNFIDAFEALYKNDFVIWKAIDWGYYLIGMKELNTYIFNDIVFSTNEVFDNTIYKIRKHNNSFWLIEEKRDIDELNDLLEEKKIDDTWFFKTVIDKINEK